MLRCVSTSSSATKLSQHLQTLLTGRVHALEHQLQGQRALTGASWHTGAGLPATIYQVRVLRKPR